MLRRVRTTIDLPDDLLAQARKLAGDSRRTLTEVVEDALREVLARRRRMAAGRPATLTTFGRDGLRPGVDLDNSRALLDLKHPLT
jgi:hypothetical protein